MRHRLKKLASPATLGDSSAREARRSKAFALVPEAFQQMICVPVPGVARESRASWSGNAANAWLALATGGGR
jgi:hypothetical protein